MRAPAPSSAARCRSTNSGRCNRRASAISAAMPRLRSRSGGRSNGAVMSQQAQASTSAGDPASGRDARGGREPKAKATRTRPGRSTGPRTPQGKARSARNAWRHGLSVPIRADPVWRAAVVRLERQLAGEEPVRRDLARMAAEAVVELRRIALARDRLITAFDGASTIDELRKLDRYEGSTCAKKRRAFRLLSCGRILGVAIADECGAGASFGKTNFPPRPGACGARAPFRKTNFRPHGWVWR